MTERVAAIARPLSVTVMACVMALAGLTGLICHTGEFTSVKPFPWDAVWISFVRVLAIVCGWFMLRGRNWARWLTVVWIASHVVLSAFHSLGEVIVHALLLAVFTYFLFRPTANQYFSSGSGVGPASG